LIDCHAGITDPSAALGGGTVSWDRKFSAQNASGREFSPENRGLAWSGPLRMGTYGPILGLGREFRGFGTGSPYSPELNPAERLWEELREKWFANRLFNTLRAVEIQLQTGLDLLAECPEIVRSIAGHDELFSYL
jgi:hypothetical protein